MRGCCDRRIDPAPLPKERPPLARDPWSTHFRRLNQALVVPPIPRHWIGFLYRHPKLTFLLMGGFFLLFGFTSVNLFVVLKANIELFLEYGPMVIEDGALQQFVEIIGSSYLSIVFYVFFKVCERVLIERLTGKPLGEIRDVRR